MGVVIGCVVVVAAIAGGVLYMIRKRAKIIPSESNITGKKSDFELSDDLSVMNFNLKK